MYFKDGKGSSMCAAHESHNHVSQELGIGVMEKSDPIKMCLLGRICVGGMGAMVLFTMVFLLYKLVSERNND